MGERIFIIMDKTNDPNNMEPYKLICTPTGWDHKRSGRLYRWDQAAAINGDCVLWELFGGINCKFDGQTSLRFEHVEVYDAEEVNAFHRAVSASIATLCGMFRTTESVPDGLLVVPDGVEIKEAGVDLLNDASRTLQEVLAGYGVRPCATAEIQEHVRRGGSVWGVGDE